MTSAELERLALLLEEMGEAQQCIGKIIRHGYENYNPFEVNEVSNREALEKELGHVKFAIDLMIGAGDLSDTNIMVSKAEKRSSVRKWLHYQ